MSIASKFCGEACDCRTPLFIMCQSLWIVYWKSTETVQVWIRSYSYMYFLKIKLKWDLYLYDFVFANFFRIFLSMKLFLKQWETCAWLCFFWFSQRVFSLQHFWAWTLKLFPRTTKLKRVNKSFEVIITKYTLHVSLAFTV